MQPKPWRGLSIFEKLLLILLPLVAVGLFLVPFLDQAVLQPLRRLPGMRPFVGWLVNENGSWIMLAAVLVVWLLLVLFERSRLNNNKDLWFDTGCPQCAQRELVRVSRHRLDRFYGLIGVRAYRYACRNCTWRGLRIGRRHHHFDEMALAEELRLAEEAELAAAGVAGTVGASGFLPPVLEPEKQGLAADDLADATVISPIEESPTEPHLSAVDELPPPAPAGQTEPLGATAPRTGQTGPLGPAAPAEEPKRPPETSAEMASEIARLKKEAGFSDDELEWLWRRLSEDK